MWWGLASGTVDTGDFEFEPVIEDIQTLNEWSLEGRLEVTATSLATYPQIQLIKSDYRDWIRTDSGRYDLIHVDIVHTYAATYECGLWSARHSQCTLFHDTESFPDVKRAVSDIARQTNKEFYNFHLYYGLGIVV